MKTKKKMGIRTQTRMKPKIMKRMLLLLEERTEMMMKGKGRIRRLMRGMKMLL